MKVKMTAEDFWNKFALSFSERLQKRPDWEAKYTSDNIKEWTNFIYEYLWDLASTLNYSGPRECSKEYLRTDMGFYDIDHTSKEVSEKYKEFEWDFDVAIEHENDETAWLDEFVKLVHVNCGLKVIISYYSDKTLKADMLDIAEKIYNNRKYKNLNDQWLIILGPCNKEKDRAEDFIAFKSIIDKDKEMLKFEKLEEKKIIFANKTC